MKYLIARSHSIHGNMEERAQKPQRDEKFGSYYNYYSNKKWGDAASYQLCIDSSVCGIDGSVEAILNFVALKEAAAKKK